MALFFACSVLYDNLDMYMYMYNTDNRLLKNIKFHSQYPKYTIIIFNYKKIQVQN